jgi:hypothetical protein
VPIAADVEEGRLAEIDGEAAYLEPLRQETVADLDFLILGGSERDAEARSLASTGKIPLHDAAEVPIATHGCAALLEALSRPPQAAAFTLILPAAEEADAGIQELFHQAADALNLRPTEAKIFHDRLAFNLFRDKAVVREEQRIRVALLERFPSASLSVTAARAGIFHGYAGGASFEFPNPSEARKARHALDSSDALSVGSRPGHAAPGSLAEEERVRLDPPEVDGARMSLWFAFDALALAARSALRAAVSRLG